MQRRLGCAGEAQGEALLACRRVSRGLCWLECRARMNCLCSVYLVRNFRSGLPPSSRCSTAAERTLSTEEQLNSCIYTQGCGDVVEEGMGSGKRRKEAARNVSKSLERRVESCVPFVLVFLPSPLPPPLFPLFAFSLLFQCFLAVNLSAAWRLIRGWKAAWEMDKRRSLLLSIYCPGAI